MNKLSKPKAPVVLAAMAKQITQDRVDDAMKAIDEVRKKAPSITKALAKAIRASVNDLPDEKLLRDFGICHSFNVRDEAVKNACQDLFVPQANVSIATVTSRDVIIYPRGSGALALPRKYFPKTFKAQWESLMQLVDRIMAVNRHSYSGTLSRVKREVAELGGLEAMEYADQLLVNEESRATIKKLCEQLKEHK